MNSPYQYGAVQRQYQNNQVPVYNNGYILLRHNMPTLPRYIGIHLKIITTQAAPPQNNVKNLTLKSLEKMRERGLISEENYFKKLKELGY